MTLLHFIVGHLARTKPETLKVAAVLQPCEVPPSNPLPLGILESRGLLRRSKPELCCGRICSNRHQRQISADASGGGTFAVTVPDARCSARLFLRRLDERAALGPPAAMAAAVCLPPDCWTCGLNVGSGGVQVRDRTALNGREEAPGRPGVHPQGRGGGGGGWSGGRRDGGDGKTADSCRLLVRGGAART